MLSTYNKTESQREEEENWRSCDEAVGSMLMTGWHADAREARRVWNAACWMNANLFAVDNQVLKIAPSTVWNGSIYEDRVVGEADKRDGGENLH